VVDALSRGRRPRRSASAPATPSRPRSASNLNGNDLSEDRNPIEAASGWCCRKRQLHRADRSPQPAKERHRRNYWSPSPSRRPRQPPLAPGQTHHRGAKVTSGTPALPQHRHRHGYLPPEKAEPGTAFEIDVRGKRRPPRSRSKPLYPRSTEPWPMASYPDDLKYHAEHDWARVDGDVATLGITWYAQDQLGEVVFFDPPSVGATLTKDSPYAEVESVKAVSDVIAPVSGRDRRSQRALKDSPVQINEDPYGEGWLVKVRLSETSELDSLLDSESYQSSLS
jgi:glycine cleavage system H protein